MITTFWVAPAAAAIVAAAAWFHGHHVGAGGVQARWDAEKHEALAQVRETEVMQRKAQERITNERRAEILLQNRRVAALADVASQLRERVAVLAGQPTPASPDGVAPAAGAGLVLANLYRGADQEAVELAAAFDSSRAAGLGCERSYDSLSGVPP